MGLNDFDSIAQEKAGVAGASVSSGHKRKLDTGESREYLKVFETLPPQLLNAFGESKFMKMGDADVWAEMNKPLKSGAPYMTEFCDAKKDRRGIGANRWILTMKLFCKYQLTEEGKKHNNLILKPDVLKGLYAEIEKILPSLDYCLAPKPKKEATGAAALRSQIPTDSTECMRDLVMLDKHAQALYAWLDKDTRSYLRMMTVFLSEGGLSFNAAVYHRSAGCFRYHGNSSSTPDKPEVSLSEFQECIRARHTMNSRGNPLAQSALGDVDTA